MQYICKNWTANIFVLTVTWSGAALGQLFVEPVQNLLSHFSQKAVLIVQARSKSISCYLEALMIAGQEPIIKYNRFGNSFICVDSSLDHFLIINVVFSILVEMYRGYEKTLKKPCPWNIKICKWLLSTVSPHKLLSHLSLVINELQLCVQFFGGQIWRRVFRG